MKNSPERHQIRNWDVISLTPKEIKKPEFGIELKVLDERDADFILQLAMDKDVARYVPWAKNVTDEPSANEQGRKFSEQFSGLRAARYGIRKDDDFCGYLGLWPNYEPDTYEVGFAVLPEFRGQNIAGGALELVELELVRIGANKLIAHVDESNTASQRVLEKQGFNPTDQFNEASERRYEKDIRGE